VSGRASEQSPTRRRGGTEPPPLSLRGPALDRKALLRTCLADLRGWVLPPGPEALPCGGGEAALLGGWPSSTTSSSSVYRCSNNSDRMLFVHAMHARAAAAVRRQSEIICTCGGKTRALARGELAMAASWVGAPARAR
jgi:hypothetical protein